ncbi:MAG: hypothetical protein KME07_24675 [Pegethrix bostrychoides GSE-TBD4-15B]|jgi:hypothetical protein|uniref:Uncharacterized protein n=1 Tax=Pegethrix bostrychoides GSE-TBD4-15B TaxID=2839662 RepID=A0A951PGP4_9CYAN|nr:hypothetical protein [Pegethrix bostrychoides GSE-TBD4-15B]
MSYDYSSNDSKLPAPCIVDVGTVINKQDMLRILSDLGRVRYCYSRIEPAALLPETALLPEAEGFVLEVFSDPQRSTLVANHALYINVCSFDYLKLDRLPDQQPCFDLIQEHQRLRIVPLSNPLQEQRNRSLNTAALEAVVAEVLSASWDMRLDDDENFSF